MRAKKRSATFTEPTEVNLVRKSVAAGLLLPNACNIPKLVVPSTANSSALPAVLKA